MILSHSLDRLTSGSWCDQRESQWSLQILNLKSRFLWSQTWTKFGIEIACILKRINDGKTASFSRFTGLHCSDDVEIERLEMKRKRWWQLTARIKEVWYRKVISIVQRGLEKWPCEILILPSTLRIWKKIKWVKREREKESREVQKMIRLVFAFALVILISSKTLVRPINWKTHPL